MGRLRRALGLIEATTEVGSLTRAESVAYPSPLYRTDLTPDAAAAFGVPTDLDTITRTEAMRVPAVRRARAVIAGTIGSMTWQATRGATAVDRVLLDQPDPNTTRQWVFAWLVDDLLFNGVAWWRVTDRDGQGFPASIERLDRSRVQVLAAATDRWSRPTAWSVYVDGERVNDRDVIRFDGPDEGVLTYGATTLRTALMLEAAVRKFAKLDVPLGYLTPEDGAQELSTASGSAGDGTDRSEVDALLDEWETARATRTTAFLNRALKYQTVMFDAQRVQLSEARQYQAAEVARLMNLPPRFVNAPNASGMTYSNTESDRRDLLDTTLSQYVEAVAQRLSMPDVTPRGQVVGPDVRSFLRGDTTQMLTAAQIAVQIGVMDPTEVRNDWLQLPGPAPGVAEAAAATPVPPRLAVVPGGGPIPPA